MKTKHDLEEKRLLALHRERMQLWRASRQLVPLERPLQKGWMRCYFLTDTAEQRPDAPTLHAILQQINVTQYYWRRSFAPTKRNRRAQQQQFYLPLKRLRVWRPEDWVIPHAWRSYFLIAPVFAGCRWRHELRFRWPQLVELRIVPRMVYELPVCDPENESREAEIGAYLANPRRSGRLHKLLGKRRWPSRMRPQKELDELALKRMRAALAGNVEAEKTSAKLAPSPPRHLPCSRSSTDRAPRFERGG